MRDAARRLLLQIFQAALSAVNGRELVREYLALHRAQAPLHLVALGKVACPMAQGAIDAGAEVVSAIVITKREYGEPLAWPVLEAAHPVPDDTSLAAGAALTRFIVALPADARVLFLLSGGASALVEELPPGVDLVTLQRMNQWLLASGRDIVAMNRVRKRLSLIKGGRLARLLAPRETLCLAISDVPSDDPRFIGSGLLVADDTVQREPIDDAPADIRAALERAPAPPSASDGCFTRVRFEVVGRLADAKRAAAAAASARGFAPIVHPQFVEGDAAAVGARLARELLASPAGALHVWGGETTVTLPAHPGRGGRNQHLALAAARALRGQRALFLAAGTDGTDGPTADAGALVDGDTLKRGATLGLDADAALLGADAGNFLEASGDLIHTGPTGTNVMDLMLGLRLS